MTGSLQVGFLYLRFVLNPRKVWEWIEPYLGDPEVGVRPVRCEAAQQHASQQ